MKSFSLSQHEFSYEIRTGRVHWSVNAGIENKNGKKTKRCIKAIIRKTRISCGHCLRPAAEVERELGFSPKHLLAKKLKSTYCLGRGKSGATKLFFKHQRSHKKTTCPFTRTDIIIIRSSHLLFVKMFLPRS